jgi:hypothetical protein
VNATADGGGSDEADLSGSPGNDTFTALASGLDALDYQTAGHVTVAQFAVVAVQAGAGNDTAYLAGHAGANTFTAGPAVATLSGTGYAVTLNNYRRVQATAGSSNDVAHLNDSAGDDVLVGTSSSSTLQSAQQGAATSYANVAVGFGQVFASSSTGNDTAQLSDSAGNASFSGSRNQSTLQGTGYFLQAANFFLVIAFAPPGGNDTATLTDSPQNDVFETLGADAELFGADYVVVAKAFAQVSANDTLGGNDQLFVQPNPPYAFQATGNWTVPPPGATPPPAPTNRTVIG